ncbi:MAG TPA: cation:proton antiporter [Bryobacteraceae bacterium]|nr:cation:proton antiporter [Bryobacteraceae bacterium]
MGIIDRTFENALLLLLIASVVAMLSRRLRLPYSAGLVAAGLTFAALPFTPHLKLTRDLIFTALLPPLLFEAALCLNWRQVQRDFRLIGTLATLGVVISGAITAAGMHLLANWEWSAALVFGALIAATDPVSVIATFRDAKAHGRLLVLIESESLFNDGTAAVAFAVVVAIVGGQSVTTADVAAMLVRMIGGGVLCGAAVGAAASLLAWRTQDHLVEITLTTVAAYGSFLLADHLGTSGVLATISAGLAMASSTRRGVISPRGQEAVLAFWEYAAFVANSVIFLLIGVSGEGREFAIVPAIAAVAVVLVSRAAAIYPCCALFIRSESRVKMKHQNAMFWGGLRGALALALALGLPESISRRNEIEMVSFAVVAFSVFVQGLTMTPLLRRIGEIP